MPTIKYCDYINGNDTTGNGSYSSPYKTITKASTGLTGGDEVRVAKSPDDTALTGTLTFTEGSTTLTGSGTLFTTELVIGDFVKGADNQYYEVVTISSNTAAVLYQKYPSSTQSGVSSYKMGVTSTGAAAGSTTQVQAISASGSSTSSRLKISGGWDLASQTQTGVTNFRQLHSTFANRWGYALYATGKSYTEIDKCNFFRYNYGIYYAPSSNYNTIITATCNSNSNTGITISSSSYTTIITATCNSNSTGITLSSSSYNTITTATCNSNNYGIYLYSSSNNNTITTATCISNNSSGIYLSASSNNTITTATCNSNNSTGITIASSSNNTTITTATCNSNGSYGITIAQSSNNTITTATCNSNSYGISLNLSSNNTITTATCNSNNINALYSDNSINNIIHKLEGTGNIGLSKGATIINNLPFISIQWNNAKGTSKNYFYGGETYSNTSEARSGKCLHYDPSDATYYMSHSFYFKATDATATTLSAYIKKKNLFNGDVSADCFFLGASLFGWTDWTPSSDDTYEQKTFSVTSGMITDDGVIEMRIRVRGTAGDIYVDDLGAT